MFKFLHAADIHLDSPLRGLGRSDDLPADEIRGASRKALDNLVRLAIAERVAFVLIAGDVYDGDWKDHNTGLWFVKQMARLRDAKIRVFLIRGNHDAKSKITTDLALPDNVHQFRTDRAESVKLDAWDVIIHGQGFATEKVEDDLAARYPNADRACLNIGLLHTSATGRDGHDRYAPCTVDALRSKGYGYWALGHIHKREMLSEGETWVAFSGNLQGRHIRESGAKGCMVVTVDDKGAIASAKFEPLDVMRWETCRIDATGMADVDDLLHRFEGRIPDLLDSADGRSVAIRIEVEGACPGHTKLSANLPALDAHVRAKAMGVANGRIWVEKVKLRTTPERIADLDDIGDDAIGVLLATLDDFRRDPTALIDLAGKELADLRKRLAGELDAFEGVNFESADWLRATLDEARPLLLAKLTEGLS
jgi:exonuclease SbcD